ncbi:hypothetical protein NMY22_g18668 [Coprinellus aureogranulatus]|nr:hypothetical protein NMY22_g18668 [Coprinellus aureogranulatus]
MKPGFHDPEANKGKPRHGSATSLRRILAHYGPRSLRQLLIQAVAAALFVLFMITMVGHYPMHRRWRQKLKDLVVIDDTWRDLDLNTPPRYLDVYEEERRLPQHNLSLPFPEGATGRYVKFTSQINMLGWNNVLNEL